MTFHMIFEASVGIRSNNDVMIKRMVMICMMGDVVMCRRCRDKVTGGEEGGKNEGETYLVRVS